MELEDKIKALKDTLDTQSMPPEADKVFANRLQIELHTPAQGRSNGQKVFYWIAGVAAVLMVVFQVTNLGDNGQNKEFDAMVTNLSQTNQASEQLETINTLNTNFDVKDDSRFVHALVAIIQEENSANVKITAINTLVTNYSDKDFVRRGLIQALENETEPLVQIKLIKTLTILKEARAQQPLEQIIANRENVSAVRNSAQLAMTNLKNQ